jgi:hypothetical protein
VSLQTQLIELGLPAPLAAQVTGDEAYPAVLRVLTSLPVAPPPPAGPGEILVIVGDVTGGLAVAREVSRTLRLSPRSTRLAAAGTAGIGVHPNRRLAGPDAAAKWAERARRAGVPAVVVVDAPFGGTGAERAQEMLAALRGDTQRPIVTWAVVDATRKTADSARQLRALAPVDAIAVRGCTRTADPASVLHLGRPLAMLDERPPTPHAWAALLTKALPSKEPLSKEPLTQAPAEVDDGAR